MYIAHRHHPQSTPNSLWLEGGNQYPTSSSSIFLVTVLLKANSSQDEEKINLCVGEHVMNLKMSAAESLHWNDRKSYAMIIINRAVKRSYHP
jgi:hypothetical protein